MSEIAETAKRIYREQIEPGLFAEDLGKLVMIEIKSGDYEISSSKDHLEAVLRLRARHEKPEVFTIKAGYRAAVVIGGSMERLRLEDWP